MAVGGQVVFELAQDFLSPLEMITRSRLVAVELQRQADLQPEATVLIPYLAPLHLLAEAEAAH